MSLTSWQPTVKRIKDGESVDQATVNVTVDQLTQRDQHLYEKFDEMAGKSALISFGKAIFPTETLNPGELNVVYFKGDGASAGLAKAVTGFSSSTSSSMFVPNDSNYAFGIVKTVYTTDKTADVYTQGLCEFQVDMDDSSLGLLQEDASGNVEPFEVGPYYLSSKSPGKLTNAPSGIPVYVGYAISKREFLLHTTVEEFSQFFINYRYHILDRVAGIPVLTTDTWEITAPDVTRLGWIPATSAGGIAPDGAVFYYNIPAATLGDDDLTDAEKAENLELSQYLPPIPANFVQLYQDGSLLRYKDDYDTGGTYTTNAYGLWWCTDVDGFQPWSGDYPQDGDGAPSEWLAIKETIAASRKNVFMSFSKFNPALRTQLVSSLSPRNVGSGNFIKFYKDVLGNAATSPYTGDLLYSIETSVTPTGTSVDDSAFSFPAGLDAAYTKGRAIAALKYDPTTGAFKAAVTPVVAKLNGVGNVRVVEQSPAGSGVFNVSYIASGMSGPVDSIEPINARQEFRGLSSYIKLPQAGNTPYGLVGKIVLQRGYVNNSDLKIVFHLFGDTDITTAGSAARRIALQFEYSSVSAVNGGSPTANTVVTTLSQTPGVNPVEINISAAGTTYAAFSSLKTTATNVMIGSFTVPAVNISEDSIVNFKISRIAPSDPATDYAGNVGILAAYWEI